MIIETLDKSEVVRIHLKLVDDFTLSSDPISPPGIRSDNLLESAVARQYVSYGDKTKYNTLQEIAATLMYGLCLNHPFHNGNKRTALVSMLALLDKNKYSLVGVKQNDVYNMIIDVADHSFGKRYDHRKKDFKRQRRSSDEEIAEIASWIKQYMHKVMRGDREITFRDLKNILKRFSYELRNRNKGMIDIIKFETITTGFLKKRTAIKEKHINSIPFPGNAELVSIHLIKKVRKICGLTEEDGIDSSAFYDEDAIIDSFINRYRTILRRLARR